MRRRESSRVRKIRRRYSTSSTDPDELNKLRLQLLLLDRDHAEGSTALSFDQQAEKADARETSAGSSTFFYDTTSTVASPTSDTNPLVSDTTDTKMPRSFQVQRLDGAALGAVQPPTRANTNTTVPPTESKSSAARNRVGHRQFPSYGQHEVFIESTHKNPIVSKRSSSTPPILSRLGRQRKYNDSRCNQRAPSTATASSINGRLSRESELRSRLGPFDSHTSPPSGGRWMIGHEIKNGELTREEFEALPVAIRRKTGPTAYEAPRQSELGCISGSCLVPFSSLWFDVLFSAQGEVAEYIEETFRCRSRPATNESWLLCWLVCRNAAISSPRGQSLATPALGRMMGAEEGALVVRRTS
ncbi:hypothetical protein MKZ38_010674 [Zalerion maritima]|uniref:Uncharacterized protein n=1 Tax=Zalerion maritima TaxID=339359 RepID=A0AAD5RGF6_9PEZI|nr:hypothetical protein MKZ38_010674 [Zalerion maritima]